MEDLKRYNREEIRKATYAIAVWSRCRRLHPGGSHGEGHLRSHGTLDRQDVADAGARLQGNEPGRNGRTKILRTGSGTMKRLLFLVIFILLAVYREPYFDPRVN